MNVEVQKKLSNVSLIFGGLSVILSLFLAINSFHSFYRMKILGHGMVNFHASFFTEKSLMWAHLIFGFIFLGAIYLVYLAFKKQSSFNIFMSFVYTFAFISLFVSYIA